MTDFIIIGLLLCALGFALAKIKKTKGGCCGDCSQCASCKNRKAD